MVKEAAPQLRNQRLHHWKEYDPCKHELTPHGYVAPVWG